MTSELCYLSIAETGPLLKSQQLSPVELTNAFLDRIDGFADPLYAFVDHPRNGIVSILCQAPGCADITGDDVITYDAHKILIDLRRFFNCQQSFNEKENRECKQ